MNKHKLSVGQPVYFFSKRSSTPGILRTSTISKVGNKYFEVESILRIKFDVDTLKDVTSSSYSTVIYIYIYLTTGC